MSAELTVYGDNITEYTNSYISKFHTLAFPLSSLVSSGSLPGTECLCPPQIHMLKPHLWCDGIRRWDLWEVTRSWRWSLQDGIRALLKEPPESSLAPSATRGHDEKMACLWAKKQALIRSDRLAPWSWIPSLQNCGKQIWVVWATRLWCFCYSSLSGLRLSLSLNQKEGLAHLCDFWVSQAEWKCDPLIS